MSTPGKTRFKRAATAAMLGVGLATGAMGIADAQAGDNLNNSVSIQAGGNISVGGDITINGQRMDKPAGGKLTVQFKNAATSNGLWKIGLASLGAGLLAAGAAGAALSRRKQPPAGKPQGPGGMG